MRFVYLVFALLYVFSPYDLLPDVITGLGWLDDILVLVLLFRYFSKFHAKPIFSSYNFIIKDVKTPFDVLGVDTASNPETIKNAYRKLAKQYHPDKVAHMGCEYSKEAKTRFYAINEAYEQLQLMGKV